MVMVMVMVMVLKQKQKEKQKQKQRQKEQQKVLQIPVEVSGGTALLRESCGTACSELSLAPNQLIPPAVPTMARKTRVAIVPTMARKTRVAIVPTMARYIEPTDSASGANDGAVYSSSDRRRTIVNSACTVHSQLPALNCRT